MESPLRSPLRYPQRYTYEKRRVYSERSEALFARMSTSPAEWHKRAIDLFLGALWSTGAYATMDGLSVSAAQDEPEAKLNWIADAYNLTESGTVTFEAYKGYTPNGSTTSLDTGFNPTTASTPKFAQTNAHMGIWLLTDNFNAGGASYDFGNANSFIGKAATSGDIAIRANRSTGSTITGVVPGATHIAWSRTSNTAWRVYKAGADVGGGTTTSSALTSYNFGVGQTSASTFGANQTAIVHYGSSLTAAQVAAVYYASRAYLLAVGAIS